eukprot:2975406-Pleurochrysis_carterae.AAC.1
MAGVRHRGRRTLLLTVTTNLFGPSSEKGGRIRGMLGWQSDSTDERLACKDELSHWPCWVEIDTLFVAA